MSPLPRLGVAARVMLGAFAFIALASVLFVQFIGRAQRQAYLDDRGKALSNRAERSGERLVQDIHSLRRDLQFVAQLPPVQDIVRATHRASFDAQAGTRLDFWETRLQDLFSAFARANSSYVQIRFIGVAGNGKELVRVDAPSGQPIARRPEELASKGDTQYFQAAVKLKPGEIHLSGIDLNRERGQLQVPHVRTLRAATPVFAADGSLFGIVVVNMDVGPAIDFAAANLSPGVQGFLMNAEGDYLAHPDPARAFGFDLGRRHTWQQDLPSLQVPAGPGGVAGSFQALSGPRGLLYVQVLRLQFDPERPERFLVLAYALTDTAVQAHLRGVRNATMAATGAIALLFSGLVYLLLRRAFAPLTRLTALAGSIGAGDYEVRLPQDAAGEIGALVRAFGGMLQGIRARDLEVKQATHTLSESERRFRALIEHSGDSISLVDADNKILYLSPGVTAVEGYTPEELVGHSGLADTHPDDLALVQQVVQRLRDDPSAPVPVLWRRRHRDGRWLWLEGTATNLLHDPAVGGIVTNYRDVTERKTAEEAVRKSEAHLRTVVDTLVEGVAVSDLDGRLLHFNRAAMELHGFSSPDKYLRGLAEYVDTFELSSPDGGVLPLEQWPLARILRGETLRDLEVGIRRVHNGWQRTFSYGGALVRGAEGEPLMAVVTMRDITERKEAERRIRAQMEHLSLLDHVTRAIGERQDLKSIFQVAVRSLEDSLPVDFGCVCLYDQVASVLRVTCVGAKSQALGLELAMAEGAAIDVDQNGLARCVQGRLVYEPDIGQAAHPFSRRLARGGQRSLVLAPLRAESGVFGVLVAGRREPDAFTSVECEFLRQLSEHVGLAAHQSQIYAALQQAYDDLRLTQQVVLQQERLRALGQMASGIAHDINNAISPVALYTESLLETEQGLSARARGYLETIQRSVEDVGHTVARMREFYRQREPQLTLAPVDANRVVQQVVDLTRARWSDMPQQRGIVITAVTELAPDLPRIMGVESEIREALTNLVFNAVDAMPGGGTLTLRTRLTGPERDAAAAAVLIEVADDGLGMSEDTRQRCLEPFFTTKGERGTGLGLAMVFGVAQRHSAALEIESAPGAGTTVRLGFLVPGALSLDPGPAPVARESLSRLGLLLIDDDPVLLKSLRETLEASGHTVTAANGGQAGIDAFRASLDRGPAFSAVITDLGMPYLDGRRVAAAVKELSPSTPVILLTGWGQRLAAEGDHPPHVDRILSKPPKLRELRDALAECLRPSREPEA